MLDKRTLDKLLPNKSDRDAAIELLKRGVSQLTRLRHPRILGVLHALEESRFVIHSYSFSRLILFNFTSSAFFLVYYSIFIILFILFDHLCTSISLQRLPLVRDGSRTVQPRERTRLSHEFLPLSIGGKLPAEHRRRRAAAKLERFRTTSRLSLPLVSDPPSQRDRDQVGHRAGAIADWFNVNINSPWMILMRSCTLTCNLIQYTRYFWYTRTGTNKLCTQTNFYVLFEQLLIDTTKNEKYLRECMGLLARLYNLTIVSTFLCNFFKWRYSRGWASCTTMRG